LSLHAGVDTPNTIEERHHGSGRDSTHPGHRMVMRARLWRHRDAS
jgi:hypothetical protein